MEPVLFILLITLAGSSGLGILSQCEISRCNTFTPDDGRRVMENFPPNEEELKEICPPLLELIECFTPMIEECTAELVEDYGARENVTVAQVVSTIQSVMSLIIDVCDEDSQLGRDLRASAHCLKKALPKQNEHCRSESYRLYDDFRLPGMSFEESEMISQFGYKLPEEVRCLYEQTAAYEMACNLKDIQKTCGSMARDVVLELVKRPKFIVNMGICSEEDLFTLKGEFLDFLEEQGEHRDFFANAFEFRKRRK